MTVESAPAREPSRLAPRKRLEPTARAHWRAVLMLFACACTALATCAIAACGDRPGDARVALTANAARELADTPSTTPAASFGSPSPSAQTEAPGAPSPGFADSSQRADAGIALPANTVRSPAKPFAVGTQAATQTNAAPQANAPDADAAQTAQDAQTAQNAPLAPPEIHTAE